MFNYISPRLSERSATRQDLPPLLEFARKHADELVCNVFLRRVLVYTSAHARVYVIVGARNI